MPRAGLTTASVVAAAAQLADDRGLAELTMARIAERVGVRAPSLYKHVASQDALVRGIAVLGLTEAGEAMGTAIQGLSGRDALAAAARAFRGYVLAHPGRYAATVGLPSVGPDDPLGAASLRSLAPLEAVLRGYGIEAGAMMHALRIVRSALHGFATLESEKGFRWSADVDESFERLVDLLDRGLAAEAPERPAPRASTGL